MNEVKQNLFLLKEHTKLLQDHIDQIDEKNRMGNDQRIDAIKNTMIPILNQYEEAIREYCEEINQVTNTIPER